MKTSGRVLVGFAFFILACSFARGQGCGLSMTPNYDDYVSVAISGSTISTTVQVLGTTFVQPSAGCNLTSVTHQGKAYNKIGTAGGWVYGTPVSPSSYINVTNNQSFTGTPGNSYLFSWQAQVNCSMAGLFFNDSGSSNIGVPLNLTKSNNVWFFGVGVQTPSGFTLGGTSATVTANGATTGTFGWTVSVGSSNLAFENGSTSITKANSNTVTIYSKSYSTANNDTSIKLTYTPSGSSQQIPSTMSLTIDSPLKLASAGVPIDQGRSSSQGCSDSGAGSDGYASFIPYQVLSFTGLVVSNVPINEVFTYPSNPTTNNWQDFSPGSFVTPDGTFSDMICVVQVVPGSKSPQPLPPQTPLLSTIVKKATQTWYIGITTSGLGVGVQTNEIDKYVDHGRHANVVSPIR